MFSFIYLKKGIMSEHINRGTLKVTELIGISQENFEDAVRQAVRRVSSSVQHVKGVEVLKFSAEVNNGEMMQYRANVKVAFVVNE